MRGKNKILRYWYCALAVTLCFALLGCSTISMTPEQKKSIKKIAVSKDVLMPKEMTYKNRDEAMAIVLYSTMGLIPGCALGLPFELAVDKEKKGIEALIDHEGIKITEIVRNDVINQLKQDGRFKIVDEGGADASLHLEIKLYGLFVPSVISTKFRPYLSVKGKLLSPSDKILWQDSGLMATGDLPKFSKEEILRDPHNIYLEWDAAAKVVAKKLLKSLDS
ncbi:MAG: hypothetical protein WCE22_00685 [Candidatus Aquirickettsiella gammari]|mgnify:CR=1 FL=1|jgi:hypothetical protein